MRDDARDLVNARAVELEETSNVVAEAKAFVEVLEHCVQHDLHPFILETD